MTGPDPTVDGPVAAWETPFADGLVATSRATCEPWLAGHVHVVRALPAQLDPVETGGLGVHYVAVFDAPGVVRDRVPGRPPGLDGPVRPGDVYVQSSETTRDANLTSWDDGFSFTSLMLPPPTVAQAARTLGLDYARLAFRERYAEPDPVLAILVRQLGTELVAGAPGGRPYAEHLLHAVAVHLVRHHTDRDPAAVPTGGLPAAALRRARDLARSRLSDPDLSVDDLASVAGYTPWHFARAFRRSTGESPAAWVARLRMAAAARVLADPARAHWSVAVVAAEVGYTNPTSFAAAFRRAQGVAPSRYRRETAR